MDESPKTLSCRCCIVGGGPAGMVLGLLLARAGVDTVVVEKHGDFLRDFRGDTIHPSTLEALHDLGLLEDFLKLPHQKATLLKGKVGDVDDSAGGFFAFADPCQIHCLHAAMGFFEFHRKPREALSELPASHEHASRRPCG